MDGGADFLLSTCDSVWSVPVLIAGVGRQREGKQTQRRAVSRDMSLYNAAVK